MARILVYCTEQTPPRALQDDSRHVVAMRNTLGTKIPTAVAYMCYRFEEDPPEEERIGNEDPVPVAYLYCLLYTSPSPRD